MLKVIKKQISTTTLETIDKKNKKSYFVFHIRK